MLKLMKRPLFIVLLFVIITIPVIRLILLAAHKSNLYEKGASFEIDAAWSEAFYKYFTLYELDPEYRDVKIKLDEVLDNLMQDYPEEMNLLKEVSIIRWLAASGDSARLADVLDRSTVNIPAGHFIMGTDTDNVDERPQRTIYLDAFEIDRYEVTNVQYQRFLMATGRTAPLNWDNGQYPMGQADHPVVGVNWPDADAYCVWAGKRLPTEAEWEKACRGTDGRRYPWGDRWEPDYGNLGLEYAHLWPIRYEKIWEILQASSESTNGLGPTPVGSYPEGASPYGVLDMVGNAKEWVADWYDGLVYSDMSDRNPIGVEPQWEHSIRGSGWISYHGSEDWVEDFSRCTSRNSSHAYYNPKFGFRCVWSGP